MKKWNALLTGCFSLSTALLSAEEAVQGARDNNLYQTFIMVAIAIGFFYLILWRPEQKRKKALDDQRSQMKKGDQVTAMGILGTVYQIKEQTVILSMCDGSKIEVLKGAINEVIPS